MKIFRRKELRDVWADESKMIGSYEQIWRSSVPLQRLYAFKWDWAMSALSGTPIVELGGGAGFIREIYPEVITTDRLPFPRTSVACDATCLPFADNAVAGIVCVAFFHHCTDIPSFFRETLRVLKPGGRMVIIDPYITPGSRLVYWLGTDELVDLNERPLQDEIRKADCPLLEANPGRATLVFKRDRALYDRMFPALQVASIDYINFFRLVASGSCVQKSPFPDGVYSVADWIDRALHPLRHLIGMVMRVVLEKQKS